MRILLITFSGTGNTAKCGDFIMEHLVSKGHTVDHYIYSHKNNFDYSVNKYDMIGIGYPIHAFNIAKPFLNFIKKLPISLSKQKYFIYKVSGEPFSMNNASSVTIDRVLRKKHYVKIAEKHFLMPYNIVFRYRDEIVKQMYMYLKPLSYAYVDSLFSNDPETIKYSWSKIISFIFRIEWIASAVNKLFVHSKKNCIHCNKCINDCPMDALYVNKKGIIKSTSKCALCMRCSYNCPINAMHMGFLNSWVVNPPYSFDKIDLNEKVTEFYINKNTKGYFRHFAKYFEKQDQFLAKYGYSLKF